MSKNGVNTNTLPVLVLVHQGEMGDEGGLSAVLC